MKKDESVMISNFDAATRLLNKQELKKLNFRDKVDLFFIDYDLIPLLFQENYLSAAAKDTPFENIVKAADSISTSDIVSRSIRKNNDWGLMPNLAFSSTIFPGHLINGYIGFPKFPEWLGKNSSQRKILREIKEY